MRLSDWGSSIVPKLNRCRHSRIFNLFRTNFTSLLYHDFVPLKNELLFFIVLGTFHPPMTLGCVTFLSIDVAQEVLLFFCAWIFGNRYRLHFKRNRGSISLQVLKYLGDLKMVFFNAFSQSLWASGSFGGITGRLNIFAIWKTTGKVIDSRNYLFGLLSSEISTVYHGTLTALLRRTILFGEKKTGIFGQLISRNCSSN